MTKKKMVVLVAMLGAMFLFSVPCFSANSDSYPLVAVVSGSNTYDAIQIGDVTFLPANDLASALGAKLNWDNALKGIEFTRGDKNVFVRLNRTDAFINDKEVKLPVAPVEQNDVKYVPARIVCEALGASVYWDGYRVHINANPTAPPVQAAPVTVVASASTTAGYVDPNAPAEFRAAYAKYPYNSVCGETRFAYSNEGVPKWGASYGTDIYIARDTDSIDRDIVIKNRQPATLEVAKVFMQLYCHDEYEKLYQRVLQVENPEQAFHNLYFDGKKVDCFIDQSLTVRIYDN